MKAVAAMALATASIFALGGCNSLVSAQGGCTAQNAGYLDTWSCVRSKVAANQAGMMNNDLGIRYLAVGDALAEKVRLRQVSDADAKVALARELSAANGEFEARKGITCSTIGTITNCY